jgi:hypothetical protein
MVNREQIAISGAAYRRANKDKIARYKAEYNKANRDKRAMQRATYRQSNLDKIALYQVAYQKENREKLNAYYRNRRKNDPIFAIALKLRVRVGNAIKSQFTGKANKTKVLLGCEGVF